VPYRYHLTFVLLLCFSSAAFVEPKSDSSLLRKLECGRAVNDVAFSPDGSILAAACGRWSGWGGIRLWNTSDWTATDLGQGEGNQSFYQKVAVSPSGNLVAGITESGVLSIWRIAPAGKLRSRVIAKDIPESLAFLSEDKAIVLTGGLLYEVDLKTGVTKVVAGRVQRIGVSPSRMHIAVATKQTLQLRRLPGYVTEKTLPSDFPFFAEFTPDETALVTGGAGIAAGKSVEFRSLPSGELQHEITQFRAGIFAASISHSGKSLLLAGGSYGSGGDLSSWSLPDAAQTGYRSFGKMPFESVAWSPDDSYFAAGSADGYVVLYRTADFRGPEVREQEESLCATVISEDGHPALRPLSQVPTPNRFPLTWAWGMKIDGNPDWATDGAAVSVEKWAVSASAGEDTAIVHKAQVVSRSPDSILVGDISNPGWNRGLLVRVYADNQLIASTNPGKCLAYGRLGDVAPGVTFDELRAQLDIKRFGSMPAEPLTRSVDHFRMKFISRVQAGTSETKSDAPGSKEFDELYATLLQMLVPVAKLAPSLELPPLRGLAVPGPRK